MKVATSRSYRPSPAISYFKAPGWRIDHHGRTALKSKSHDVPLKRRLVTAVAAADKRIEIDSKINCEQFDRRAAMGGISRGEGATCGA